MKLTRLNPCGDCPFRKKAMSGWLGSWNSPEELLRASESESGLPCHSSYNNSKKTLVEALKTAHVCVGSLQSANNSCKIYRNPLIAAFAKAVGKSDLVMNAWEFIEHHAKALQHFKKRHTL